MKRFIKQFLGFFIVCLLPILIAKRKGEVLILSYHRILPYTHPEYNKMQPGMVVSDKSFRKHLQWLKKWLDIVSLLDFREGGTHKKPLCVITIDDGWVDNYTYAYPIIKELKVPVTIFLVSNMLDTDNYFWPEKLSLLLGNTQSSNLIKKYVCEQYGSELMGSQTHDEIVEFLKSKSDEKILEILSKVESEFMSKGQTLNMQRQVLNNTELTEMHESGLVSYGSHTANHIRLDKVTKSKIQYELVTSKQQLEDRLKISISTFCYPNGSYTTDVVQQVSNIYDLATTTDIGWVKKTDSPYTLKRFMMHDDITNTKSLFWLRILGTFKR